MLEVFSNGDHVGRLERSEPTHIFSYEPDCLPGQAVSLLMPVGRGAYSAERPTVLHPVFDMNLPEGALREALGSMFSKALPVFDDMALLEIVGRSQIGRLRYASRREVLDEVPTQSLKSLLASRGTADLFRELLTRYARYSGISGVQPKLLIRDDGGLNTGGFGGVKSDRVTSAGATHIVKSFDPGRLPGLASNEYACLQAATACGLSTAHAEIAVDGKLLVVERFDLRENGGFLAFEDGCALSARLSREKYEGSYEQLATTLAGALRGPRGINPEMENFFRSFVFSIVVRNGDAHRKNFGVLYDDATATVWLAPVFDVVTTVLYVATDTMALTLDGTKRWPDRKRLERFGVQRCGLSPARARGVVNEVCAGVATSIRSLPEWFAHDSDAGDLSQRVAEIWAQGAHTLSR